MCVCQMHNGGTGDNNSQGKETWLDDEQDDKRVDTLRDIPDNLYLKTMQERIRKAASTRFAKPDPQETDEQRRKREQEAARSRGKAFSQLLKIGKPWVES